ncbi:MAG: AAA family ATPase [Clostridia bacterium]|nr:AAA family ATPase [Clostridia bacterium]
MNIKRAKEEIRNTIEAYLLKNEYGEYEIPVMAQRPIFLIGAPGIGKTQIMEQISRECKVGLVSYTITHHTRQSAIGLPFISKKEFDGKEMAVTEYTISEIVASIYEKIQDSGLREGILFIDEINCVSETLAPAMLQFLQCKTFGSHKIPEGWLIVAAGNPPEYNKSVREFDVVTMDRVKKIQVEPDFDAWKEYAYARNIHPAVISYLNTRPSNFYKMESTVDGKNFATPRGWEDLSRLIQVYEKLGKTVDKEVVVQYIQHPQTARDFANYLELFYKYRTDYQIDEVLSGHIDDILVKKAAHASFDEKLSVTGLLLSRLNKNFQKVQDKEEKLATVFEILKEAKAPLMESQKDQPVVYMEDVKKRYQAEFAAKKKAGLLSREGAHHDQQVLDTLEAYVINLKKEEVQDGERAFSLLRDWFNEEKETYDQEFDQSAGQLEYAFDFMESAFAGGQELVVFITELNTSNPAVSFLQEYSCERYYRYNKDLLFRENTRAILERIRQLG